MQMLSAALSSGSRSKDRLMKPGYCYLKTVVTAAMVVVCFAVLMPGQSPPPKGSSAGVTGGPMITQIDEVALKKLLVPNGKPLLINFWATWCDPCREEFPELVKINADYKGKIDFITISLDDLADINTGVPKFLTEMHAEMPAYLLKATDDEAAMRSVSSNWSGGLPFTVLFDEKGSMRYFRQGKIRPDILRTELNKETASVAAK